jgi:membrane protein required for colicin V production
MNYFDAAVALCLLVAVIAGFRAGLVRSLATIFGYIGATPFAVMLAPHAAQLLGLRFDMAQPQAWLVLFGVFFATGIAFSAFLRAAVSATIGPDVSVPDRVAGATLGAIRIMLVAVLIVLIFDRIIPSNRQPSFLADSRLRPLLSVAGQNGVRTLPPDVVAYIDRLKRERGI